VMLALVYANVPRRRRYAEAMSALGGVGLARKGHAPPTPRSGGERPRVAIAPALVNRPSPHLWDEPAGNLDTTFTEELSDLLGALHGEGATLLVITHNPVVAARAQRQIRIRDGYLSEQGPAPPQDSEMIRGQEDPETQEDPVVHYGEQNGS